MRPRFLSRIWTLVMAALFCVTALPCYAATYYVSPNGSDSSDGKSLAQPWKTLQKAAGELNIKKGDEKDTLIVRGGQYGFGVEPDIKNIIIFKRPYLTVKAYPGEVPIIDGKFNAPDDSGGRDPLYTPLIKVMGHNITISGLTVMRSNGIGISLEKTTNSKVENCIVKFTNDAAIKVGDHNIDGHNEANGCTAMYGNFARDSGAFNAWTNIGQVIQLKGSNNTVKNCIVAYGPCAGIEGFCDSNSTIENNVVFGNGLTQIHFAKSKDATIRYNLLYGAPRPRPNNDTLNPNLSWNSKGYGTGIELMCELFYDNTDWDKGHVAYGNMIANTKVGMRIGWQYGKFPNNPPYPNNKIRNITLYNNTVIEPSQAETGNQYHHGLAIKDDGHLGTGNIIKNNIFWQSSGEPAYGSASSSKIAMGYNLWSKKPASGFQRSTDPTAGASYPTLKMADYFPKTSGWNSLAGNSLTGEEFNLLATAKYAIGTGTSTPVGASLLNTMMLNLSTDSGSEDTFALIAQKSSWDVGAVVYVPGGAVADDSGDDSESDKEIPAPVLTITSQN